MTIWRGGSDIKPEVMTCIQKVIAETLDAWGEQHYECKKSVYGRANHYLYNSIDESECEYNSRNVMEVILEPEMKTVLLKVSLADIDKDRIDYTSVDRILNRINRHLNNGAFYRGDYHGIYYRDYVAVEEKGDAMRRNLYCALDRCVEAKHGYELAIDYAIKNEAFISTVYNTVPHIRLCDECEYEEGVLRVYNAHLGEYIECGVNWRTETFGCVFVDLNGYIILSTDWYAKEYIYLLEKRIEYGADYEDVQKLVRAKKRFSETYSEVEKSEDGEGFKIKLTKRMQEIVGDAVLILCFDNGRTFFAPKDVGYILDMFGLDKLEEWLKNHYRAGFGPYAYTEDEIDLDWIESDDGYNEEDSLKEMSEVWYES